MCQIGLGHVEPAPARNFEARGSASTLRLTASGGARRYRALALCYAFQFPVSIEKRSDDIGLEENLQLTLQQAQIPEPLHPRRRLLIV
jgi:hypothetical protein